MTVSTINPFTTALMPLSQAVSWYLVVEAVKRIQQSQSPQTLSLPTTIDCTVDSSRVDDKNTPLYRAVFPISTFYCLWALYNNVVRHEPDLGLYTMGILAIGSYLEKRWLSIIGNALVWLNFIVPSYYILGMWDAAETAEHLKNDTSQTGVVWAYIFKAFFLSSIILWSFTLYRFALKSKQTNPYTPVYDV